MRKIKLFLSLLMVMLLSITQMQAVDVTFGWSQWDGVTGNFSGTTKDEVTQTVDGVVVTYSRNGTNLYANSSAIRFYGSNTLKFEAPSNYTISNIEITGSSFKNDVTTNVATCTSTTSALSWTGDASSVTFTRTGSSYITMSGASITLKANTPADPYTVSFSTGAGNPAVSPITETSGGAGITLPAGPTPDCSADGWSFAGWADDAVDTETSTAPTLLAAGTNYKPAADVTLYAVYKRTESGDVTDLEVTETFENQTAESTYNSTKNYAASASNASIAWTMYYGCVSTNVHLTGAQSAQMRWYKSATTTYGYIQNTTPISGLQSISFNAKTDNANSATMKVSVWYSTDGNEWTKVKDNEAVSSTSTQSFSATINGTVGVNYYIKIGVGDNGTAPTSSSTKLTIDDVHFSYKAGSSTTYYLSAPSCCEKHSITIANNIENGSVSADLSEACEGAVVTLTFEPSLNYHLSAWTLNGAAQDVNANTFSMPAGAATISATFDQDACDPLATPVVTVSGKAYPYNAVKLAWPAITNADSYKVYIYDAEDNELEHNDAVTGVEYTIDQALSASTTYKYSVQAVSSTPATYCPSETATGSFVTEALPTAHLTLIALGEEQQASGDYSILTPFALPNTTASCAKTFMGWDANSECASAPTYAKGAEFTFQNTDPVTLYAVYADETPGAATTTTDELDYEFTGLTGTSYKEWSGKTGTSGAVYAGQSNALGNSATSTFIQLRTNNNNSGVVTTGTGTGKVTKVTVTWNSDNGAAGITLDVYGKNTAYTQATDLYGENSGTLLGSIVKGTSTELVITGSYTYIGMRSHSGAIYLDEIDVQWTAQGESSYDNYSTTCVAAPTAEPAATSIAVAAAGGEGTLGVSYENVNLAGVTVALYNNEACTEAFDGGWLTATIEGDDKHIAYTIAENTAYAARTAYIKLTAPETSGAANPAIVVIPVEQAKKPAVFASLEDLVAAELASGTEVTVSFSNVMITEVYETNAGYRYGLYLNVKDKDGENDIELFYNKQGDSEQVPDTWVKNGYVSATNLVTTWTEYKGQWELAMQGATWSWENGDITYGAPKAVTSVVVSGEPIKKAYVDGEKFNPAGLTVTVNYTIGEPDVIAVTDADWEFTPERLAKGETGISVKATYNTVQSAAFNVTGLTVGDIQLKTVEEFIAAGNADMRCYLEGVVSDIETGSKLKYGNFNLTDASGTIYVYGCLNQAGEAQKFDELDIHNGDKIKVIAEDYDYYNSKHEAKNVQFVSKKPVATMTFDPMEMETGDEATLAPKTITLAEASAVAYSIKDGSDDCVTIDNENKKITATAAGSATIVATLAETADYVGATVEFAVTVTAPDLRSIANSPAEFDAVSGDLDPTDIKFAAYKGDGTTEPATTSNSYIRLYKPASGKTTGGYLTLTALMGFKIDQVEITFDGNATASYAVDNDAFSTEAYITGQASLLTPAGLEAQSVTIVNLKNGSIDVKAIKVWYDGEALAIHHYILGGTYETTFEQNTTFSYEGLTVTAAYDELETITEPITNFTVVADLSEEGPATASVRRNDVEIATYAITVTPGKANPNLAYTPNELEVAAADVASWEAPVFSNPFGVSPITYSSNKTAVAKVTSDGVITLQGGYGTAVITASFAGNDDYIASQATYTITVNEPVDDIKGHWVATNAVQAGMEIIIANVADANGNVKTMGSQNNNNRAAVESTVNEKGVLSPANGTKVFTLIDAGNGELAIQALNGNYLYAASTSSNHLKETSDINNVNAKWTITIEEGVATIKALHDGHTNRNWMRYNSGNDIFSCYASDQEDIVIYAISEEVKDGEVIDASSLREDEDIVINGNASMTINDEVSLGDIYVKDGQTLTIEASENATLGNLDLENGAILEFDVTPGKSVEANDLILRSSSADRDQHQGMSSQAPVMPVVNGILALEIQLRPDEMNAENSSLWYCIAAPFDVDINNGFEWVHPNGSRTPMVHNVDFQIFEYDGARRATGISGWKRISGTMKAGVAHFIGFDNARTNQNTIRLTAKTNTVAPVTEIALGEYPGASDVQNWNGVANPTMQYIGINKDIVAFDYGIQDYNTYASTAYNYFVGSPFFIQQNGGSIAIDYDDRNGAIHAPQREVENLEYCVRINAADANSFDGQMYVRASETASNSYEEGRDMASQCSTTPKYGARIWTENYNVRLGIEEAPLTNGNATYVLGIATPSAGEYTISVAAPKENADLYLTYNGSIIWNLSDGAYTVDLAKGVTSGYGLVLQAKAPHVATGVDNAEANEAGVQKVIINNHVYILRAEQMYDVTGKAVK